MKRLFLTVVVAVTCSTGPGRSALAQERSPVPGRRLSKPQALARREAARAQFAREFPGVRFSRQGSRITRVYGQPFGFGDTPQQAVEDFLAAHSEMFGVTLTELTLSRARPVLRGKFSAVTYEQTYNSLPVHAAWVTVLTRSDLGHAVVLASPHLYDLSTAQLAPVVLSARQVLAEVQQRYPVFSFEQPELVVYVDTATEEPTPLYAYRFIGGNTEKDLPELYEFMVDATSDQALVVNLKSLIRFTDVVGTVTGMGTPGDLPDRPDNLPVEMPLEDMWVRIVGGNAAYTDAAGNYVIPNSGSGAVTVEASVAGTGPTDAGRWVNVINFLGGELAESQGVTPPGPADLLFNPSPAELTTAQVNGFILTTDVHNFVKQIDPAYFLLFENIPCTVNRTDGYCPGNAWYDYSSINFCQSGSGYPNTGYTSVVYHEYGHHIVDSGHPYATGDYHEGMSDVTASLLMDTPCLGRGFTGGSTCLRNAINGINYPCGDEAHVCGQVLSGAFWLTRNELLVTEPLDYLTIIRALYLGSILMQPPLVSPDITIDVITLDDDNGDLTDGVPHWNEICTGFGAKNLDCPPLLSFEYPSGRPATTTPGQPTVFQVNVIGQYGLPVTGSGDLHYSLDGGAYQTVRMNEILSNQYEATLPPADCGSSFDWYVSAQASGAGTETDPPDAPSSAYFAIVATSTTAVLDDDFETDQGWTVGDAGDDATTGIWDRADPEGTAAQPEDDHTPSPGTKCWVTDSRAGSGLGSWDVDGGKTTLMSPTLDLSGLADSTISYWRWYSNDTGASPNADVFVVDISNDNGGTWVNVETVGPAGPGTSAGWFYHEFRVTDLVSLTDQVKMRFIASDEGDGSLVEAAIDDFQVAGFVCVPPDSDGDNIPDEVDNCPNDYNPLQEDGDTDGVGDLCDNCPADANPGQSDADGDQTGDACDGCPDEPALTAPEGPTEAACADGIDNDCDGSTDQADADCAGPSCACGDTDSSGGAVDLSDFAVFANCFGMSAPAPGCSPEQLYCSDLDGDGETTLDDFSTFAVLFGLTSTQTPPNCG